ncbi:hypothetical protein HAX54_018876 [Datura stramonium]|uniref:Uncharacterized protein n=1 Tax=Datura stramonium TaxID=4076 RepID=A0ABS8RJB7_DATST|nr:hypothetical protein [Datura stramonium]
MASSLPHVKTHSSSPQFLIPNSKISATRNLQISRSYGNVGSSPLPQPLKNGKRCILSSKCAEGGSVGEIENKLEKQIGREEDLTRIKRPAVMPIVRRWIKGPMWLHFLVGAPPVIVFSSACAGLAGGAVPAFAQLASSSYHAAISSSPLPPTASQDENMRKSRTSSTL